MGKAQVEQLVANLFPGSAGWQLLVRADWQPDHRSSYDWLCERTDQPVKVSVAELSWVGEAMGSLERSILRADPVCLVPNREHLTMLPPSSLAVSVAEASDLIDELNLHFSADPISFKFSSPDRWYALCEQPPGIVTTPLSQAVGQNLQQLLPAGPQRAQWHNWWNEIQMLFHSHPVNQLRETRGMPMINAVWFWGEGERPRQAARAWTHIFTESDIGRGLGSLTGASIHPVSPDYSSVLAENTGQALLLLDDDYVIDMAMLGPVLLTWLKQSSQHELYLFLDGIGAYSLRRSSLNKFWRRKLAGI